MWRKRSGWHSIRIEEGGQAKELTPEGRSRIYEEEKARAEARARIESERKKEQDGARKQAIAHQAVFVKKHSKWIIAVGCIFLLVVAVVWRVSVTPTNAELIAKLRPAEASVGASPSDDEWTIYFSKAAVEQTKNNHRDALLLGIQSLVYAVNSDRAASSYDMIGLSFAELGLTETAEACERKATALDPGRDSRQESLADVLVKAKKYGEAEAIYLKLLARTSDPSRRWPLLSTLGHLMNATGRMSEAKRYDKESDAVRDEAYRDRERREKAK